MSEMLWSDPQPQLGRSPSKRGVGLSFGPDVTAAFLERNGLKLVVRSHEVKVRAQREASQRECATRSARVRASGWLSWRQAGSDGLRGTDTLTD